MEKTLLKMTGRSIRASFGRFAALFLIVALSVGFFSGLKVTQADMQETLEVYFENQRMYDFRLISTLGFTSDDVATLAETEGVAYAEGSKSEDVLMEYGGNALPYTVIPLPETVNQISLTAGRLPETASECVADADAFTEADIGNTITIASGNTEDALAALTETEYTIVGLAESPLYIGLDRGTTTLAGGKLKGFLYLLPETFTGDVFTDIYITLKSRAAVYSSAYDDLIEQYEEKVADTCDTVAQNRYMSILEEYNLTSQTAALAGISVPETYILTRSENAGYVSFENDTSIVSGIANVFPMFFILVAMLVCVTTMSRMVIEERTQIGVLKAMGCANAGIIGKYLLYVGIATVLGWGVGYFAGTRGIPQVFWFAYSSIYDFAPLSYRFNLWVMAGTLLVALAGTLGSTLFACRRALKSEPAKLIRPKAPKNGKRILLERIGFVWKRLPFLQKVTMRNLFRYKSRLLMMIIGISGCTALLVTGFGVKDSLLPVAEIQYGEIQKYDVQVDFTAAQEEDSTVLNDVEGVESYLLLCESSVTLVGEDGQRSVRLLSFNAENVGDYFAFSDGDEVLSVPTEDGVLLSRQAADKLNIQVGDAVQLRDSDRQLFTLTVSGIFDNYIDNYAVVSSGTYQELVGSWQPTSAFVQIASEEVANRILELDGVSGITRLSDRKESIDNSLSCLYYIIFLIVFFAGALAFVVIYNLTNINLAERSREIATVKVLGFYPKETNAYILRENLVLSCLAALVGLPLGVLFHKFVLYRIDIDGLTFPVQINAFSYGAAFALTILFAILVNQYMKRKVEKIHMAESLKTVE